MRLKARAAISAVARARGSGLVSRTSGRRVMRASPLAPTRNLTTPSGVRGRSSSGIPGVPLGTAAAWRTSRSFTSLLLPSAAPQMRSRARNAGDDRVVHDVHLHEPLRPVGYRGDDRGIRLVGFFDHLAGVVDDAPAPVGTRRGRKCRDLHAGSLLPAAPAAAPTVANAATAPLATTAPAAARARRIRQLDLQRPAIHFLPIELLDGLCGLLGRRHLDEAEPARTAGIAIRDHRGRLDGARGGEQLAQAFVRRGEGQPPDEELLRHDQPPNSSPAADDTLWTAEVRPECGLVRRGPQ